MQNILQDDNSDDLPVSGRWKIDRRIPIAVLIGLLVQFGGALIWATELDARVERLEQESAGSSGLAERFARVEERLDDLKGDLGVLKQELDHLTEHLIGN